MQKQRNNLVFLKALRTFLFLGLALCVGMTAQAQEWNVRNIGVTVPSDMGSVTFTPDGTGATLVSPPSGDIWAGTDKFTFGYKAVTGDGTITARLDSTDMVYAWAKTGVMIRQSLAADAKMVDTVLTPGNGVVCQWYGDGSGDPSAAIAGITYPVTLKLERVGDAITSFYSTDDGANWTQIGDAHTLGMTDPVYVGIAGCANSGPGPYTTTFSNIQMTGFADAGVPPTPALTVSDTTLKYKQLTAGGPVAEKSTIIKNVVPNTTLTVSSVSVTEGTFPVSAKKNGTVVSFPVDLTSVDDELEIIFSFNPTTNGFYLGAATITTNADNGATIAVELGAFVGESSSPVTDGLMFHIDASQALYLDNLNRVRAWGDLSGSGHYVQRQGESGRPALVEGTAGIMNGKPSVLFDGAGDWMWTNPDLDIWPAREITVMFVGQNMGTSNCYLFSFDNTDDTNRCSLQMPWDGSTFFWDFGNDGGDGRLRGTFEAWGDPLQEPYIWTVQSSMKDSGQWAYRNGTLVGSDTTADDFNAATVGRFGLAGTNGGDTWPGNLYELMIFNRKLSAGELNDVGYYLQQKYGLTGNYTEPSANSRYAERP
jgi:hypothetical protein